MRTRTLQEKYWSEVACIIDYSHRVSFAQVSSVFFVVVGFLLPLIAEMSGEHYSSALVFSCISWFVAFKIFWNRRHALKRLRLQVDSLISTIKAELDLGYSIEILYALCHPSLLTDALQRAGVFDTFITLLKSEQDARGISDEDILVASRT
jgi:hypothetical protein